VIRGILVFILAWSTVAAPADEKVEVADVPALRVVYPDKPWSLVADLDGFEIGESHLNTRGDTVSIKGYDPESELLLSVRLSPAADDGGAVVCRNHYWKALRARTPGVRGDLSELGDLAVVEYAAAPIEGVTADQRQVHGCLVHDRIWIEIHLSAAVFKAGDQVTVRRTLRQFGIAHDGGAR
jgi:hypothetical protein